MSKRDFPCKSCGANLEFTPGVQQLACPYCGSENEIPQSEEQIVELDFDAADDHIVEISGPASIVITADILLADRALKKGATVISPKGSEWDENSIGGAVATRAIMADLRAGGDQIGGPKPFGAKDRSRFLSALDVAITRVRRQNR